MTLEELRKLVAGGEGDRVELKETTGQRIEACRTLCAFLNGDGGTVVFGVTKKGRLTGQLVSDETKRNLASAFCDIEPGLEIPVEYVSVDDTHQAIVCRVGGGPRKPYTYDGRPYRRLQSSTMKMPQDQYVAMIAARGGYQSKWELEWNESVTLDDIDFGEVKRTAHIAVSEGRLSSDVDINDPKDLLRRFGLLKGDQPLNGAMAVFGKNLTFYPHCILKMAWFKGKDKTVFLDNRLVTGNIIELQSEAMAFCFKHLNLSGVVKGLYREEELEVPAEALREAIINALAHRLYSSNGGVSLAIFEDRVEISNPGNFSIDAASRGVGPGMASNPRNPLIARVLYLRKAIEMWGRGIGLIVNACEKAHLAPPSIYEDRGYVYSVFARPTKQEWNDKVEKVSDNSATSGGMSVPHSGQVSLTDAVSVPLQERIDRLLRTPALTSIRSDAMRNLSLVLKELLLDDAATIESIAAKTGLSSRTVNRAMSTMATAGLVRRDGPDFGGRWIVEEI
ncbi:MAG: putative DNA binding domain-containing protein [Victivallales bacterium]|nr:putative DNA binding domain-containing protein [Victivallales bacterium]